MFLQKMSTIVVLLFSLLAGNIESSGTYNSTDQKSLTPGACILSRWRTQASFFDVNKDGKISVADAELASETFTSVLGHECKDKKMLMEEKFNNSIVSYLLWNGQEVPENEYGVLQRDAYLENKTMFRENVQERLNQFIDIEDVHNDCYISEDQLKALDVTVTYNLRDERRDNAFFESFGPDTKGIRLNKMLDYLLSYYGNDDCSGNEIQIDLLESQLNDD